MAYPWKPGITLPATGRPSSSWEGWAAPWEPPCLPVELLLDAGYGVLQVQSRACAQPPAPVTLGYKEAWDAAAGLDFLLQQPEVEQERIGIYGFSMGGAAAIRAAARNPGFSALLSEGNYFNLGADFLEADAEPPPPLWERAFLSAVAAAFRFQTGVNPWESSPIDDLPAISPRPVFLIFGEHEIEFARGVRQFQAARQPKMLWIVPGGAHGTNHLAAPEAYRQRVLYFFDGVLLGK